MTVALENDAAQLNHSTSRTAWIQARPVNCVSRFCPKRIRRRQFLVELTAFSIALNRPHASLTFGFYLRFAANGNLDFAGSLFFFAPGLTLSANSLVRSLQTSVRRLDRF
jgi:hypothetical protein